MEHKIVLGGESYLPFARSCVAKLKKLGLPYADQSFDMGDALVRVRVEPGHEHIMITGVTDLYSGVTKRDAEFNYTFRATPNAAMVIPYVSVEERDNSTLKFIPRSFVKDAVVYRPASAYSGLMAQAVQAIQSYFPSQGEVVFYSKFALCHGLFKDVDDRIWIIEIDKDRGVLAMRLPTCRYRANDPHARIVARMFGGGLPLNKTLPTDAAELARLIKDGVVLQLAAADSLTEVFAKVPFHTDMGWSFSPNGDAAYNTCHKYIEEEMSFLYRIDISITPANPDEPGSRPTGAAKLALVEQGPVAGWYADNMLPSGTRDTLMVFSFDGSRFEMTGATRSRFVPRDKFSVGGVGNGHVPDIPAKAFKGSKAPIFVCHRDGELEVVRQVCDPYKAPKTSPLYFPVAMGSYEFDTYNMTPRLESSRIPSEPKRTTKVTTTDKVYVDPVHGDEFLHVRTYNLAFTDPATGTAQRIGFSDIASLVTYVRTVLQDTVHANVQYHTQYGLEELMRQLGVYTSYWNDFEGMFMLSSAVLPTPIRRRPSDTGIRVYLTERGGPIYTRTEQGTVAAGGRHHAVWHPEVRDGYVLVQSPEETHEYTLSDYAGVRFTDGRMGLPKDRAVPDGFIEGVEFPTTPCPYAIEFTQLELPPFYPGDPVHLVLRYEPGLLGAKQKLEYPFVDANTDAGVPVESAEAPASGMMTGAWSTTLAGGAELMIPRTSSLHAENTRREVDTRKFYWFADGRTGYATEFIEFFYAPATYGNYANYPPHNEVIYQQPPGAIEPPLEAVMSRMYWSHLYSATPAAAGDADGAPGTYTLPTPPPSKLTTKYISRNAPIRLMLPTKAPEVPAFSGWTPTGENGADKYWDYESAWWHTYNTSSVYFAVSVLGDEPHVSYSQFERAEASTERAAVEGPVVEGEDPPPEAVYRFVGYVNNEKPEVP